MYVGVVSGGRCLIPLCCPMQSVPYHCMKLMFIGGPGRGKTSLLQCVLKGGPLNKKLRQSSLSTLGVQVIDWKYTHRSGDSYHLKCWDFAGQEDFYSTHQCFLTPRSVYVLVYDFNRGLSELDSIVSWLLNINARAPQSQVIIVGTHKDLVPSSECSSCFAVSGTFLMAV